LEVPSLQRLFFPVAILAGILMVVQSACDRMLDKVIDQPVMVTVISFSIGLMTLLVADTATDYLGFAGNGQAHARLSAGMQGSLRCRLSLVAAHCSATAGAAIYIGLFVTASTVMSMVLDQGRAVSQRIDEMGKAVKSLPRMGSLISSA
jgi:uncharacterized membrane protein YdcZ (DUF606 family)